MWKQNLFVPLMVVLAVALSPFVEGKSTNVGVYHISCPVDDDPNNPTHLPVQGDCTKFLKCSFGKAYTLPCPRNQEWSVELDRCESPDVAQCDPNAVTQRPVIGGEGCSFTYKKHPTDCTKFQMCAGGQITVVSCLADMYYNESENKCVADNSHC